MERKYVIMTDDGPGHSDVFLSWNTEGSYYTTVDEVDEVNEYDVHSTIDEAISRAKDADSGTLFGWQYPMTVVEVLNYEAVKEGEAPELKNICKIIIN